MNEAHAAGPTLFSVQAVTCTTTCPGIAASIGGPSEIVLVGQMSATSCNSPPLATDSFSNTYAQIQCVTIAVGGVNGVVWMQAAQSTRATGTDTITVNCASCSFTIYSVSGFVAFGASSTFTQATNSGSDTRSISILSGSLVLGAMGLESNSVSCGSFVLTSSQTLQQTFTCQTVSGQGSISGDSTSQTSGNAGTFTDSITWSCSGCNANGGGIGRFIQELQGSNSGNTVTVTQCFGNCGNPAVTLATTNSTHSVNFNNSLTLFYQFQPGLNGFFVNASASVAKTYNNGQTIYLGVYIVPTCPIGQTAFSAACPGSLISSGSFVNPSKGKVTLAVPTGATGLTPGQTAAVAVSCLFAPCDLNDTNTGVTIYQTSGVIPTVITTSSILTSCTCKTGVWTYITGNIITNVPTTTPTPAACPGILDCLLPQWAQSLCFNPTPSCVNAGGLVEAVILTLIAVAFVGWTARETMPGLKVPLGELGFFLFLIFIFTLSGVGIFFIWVPVLIFVLVSLAMSKRLGGIL